MTNKYSKLITRNNMIILLCIIIALYLIYNLFNFREGLEQQYKECKSLGQIPVEMNCPEIVSDTAGGLVDFSDPTNDNAAHSNAAPNTTLCYLPTEDFNLKCKSQFGMDWTIDGPTFDGSCPSGQKQSKCEKIASHARPTKPGCYVKRSTVCVRPDGKGGLKIGSSAGFNSWANYGYLTFPETTANSTPEEIAKSNAAIAAGMSPADQDKKCNSTGMLSWCSNSHKAVGKYPKIDWEVISIPYPKGTDYYTKPAPPPPPTKPGCYTLQPTGCPNDPKWKTKPNTWVNEDWGKRHHKNTKSVCMDRTSSLNTWCGVGNSKMHWTPPNQ